MHLTVIYTDLSACNERTLAPMIVHACGVFGVQLELLE